MHPNKAFCFHDAFISSAIFSSKQNKPFSFVLLFFLLFPFLSILRKPLDVGQSLTASRAREVYAHSPAGRPAVRSKLAHASSLLFLLQRSSVIASRLSRAKIKCSICSSQFNTWDAQHRWALVLIVCLNRGRRFKARFVAPTGCPGIAVLPGSAHTHHRWVTFQNLSAFAFTCKPDRSKSARALASSPRSWGWWLCVAFSPPRHGDMRFQKP